MIYDHDIEPDRLCSRYRGEGGERLASHLITQKVTQMRLTLIFVRVIVATVTQETVTYVTNQCSIILMFYDNAGYYVTRNTLS